MRRRLTVSDDRRIEGLSVIGFHGEVGSSHTPGQREAVFVDDEGRLAGIEEVEPSQTGETAAQAVWVTVGKQAGNGSLPGLATRFTCFFPAHVGFIVVVAGNEELKHASELGSVVAPGETHRVGTFVKSLSALGTPAPQELMVERLGDIVAWYCSPSDAAALYQRIARVAEKEMIQAACNGDESALYQMSWWRSRVALNEPDRYFAAVGLERSNRSMADAYLKSIFRKKLREELETGLDHARRQFDSLLEEERRRRLLEKMQNQADATGAGRGQSQAATKTSGQQDWVRWRSQVRGPHIIERRAA